MSGFSTPINFCPQVGHISEIELRVTSCLSIDLISASIAVIEGSYLDRTSFSFNSPSALKFVTRLRIS